MLADELDSLRLREALSLAELAIGISEPNPRVGCVIGHADGRIFGRGHTQQAGGPHAEVMALRDARAHGADLHGATAWVTLEPCAHHGRTPPCCDALIEAGLKRVVVGVGDPYPQVAGAGLARMRAAGIEVTMADAAFALSARELNIGFFSRIERGRPWVRLKLAMTLDGVTALSNGKSQWITGEPARVDTHRWRRRAGAVLTGIGTVLADDPRMDVRLVETFVQPKRIILDPALRTPLGARILPAPGSVVIIGGTADDPRRNALADAGAEVIAGTLGGGRCDISDLLGELARRGVNELHIEAGARLNAAWIESGLVDEFLVYMAPRMAGPGRPMATLAPLEDLGGTKNMRFFDTTAVGNDLRLILRPVSEFLTTPTPSPVRDRTQVIVDKQKI